MNENSLLNERHSKGANPVNPSILLKIGNMISEAEPKRASDPSCALLLTDQAIELLHEHDLNLSHEYASVLLLRCKILTEFSNYGDALKAGTEALHIAEMQGDDRLIKSVLVTIANIHGHQGIYDEALTIMHRAISLHEPDSTDLDEQLSLARALNNLGFTYIMMNNAKSGLKHVQKSLTILRKYGDKEMISHVLDSLSNAYLCLNNLPKALAYALEAHEIAVEINHQAVMAMSAEHAAKIYIQMNELKLAEQYLKQALKLATANNFLSVKAQVYQQYAELEKRKTSPEATLQHLQKALSIANKIDRKHHVSDLLQEIAGYHKVQGDFELALKYTEQYHAARENYINQKSTWRLKNLEIAYDVAQIKRDNELMHQKNLALQNTILNQQLTQYSEQLEAEVRLRTAELERSNQQLKGALLNIEHNQMELAHAGRMAAMGSMVMSIAHELNTPVGNCVLVASTLEDTTKKLATLMRTNSMRRSDLSGYLDQSEHSIRLLMKSLNATVRLVTNFRQIAITRENEDRRSFLLHQLIKEINDARHRQQQENPFSIDWDIPADLTMVSYPRSLVQVLILLIENAEVHAFDGRSENWIHIKARAVHDNIVIQIHDNGIGMSSELMTHIFDPFFTTKLGKGSNGLGLSITFNLVKNILGGEIKVTSRIGVGTTFGLTLPRVVN